MFRTDVYVSEDDARRCASTRSVSQLGTTLEIKTIACGFVANDSATNSPILRPETAIRSKPAGTTQTRFEQSGVYNTLAHARAIDAIAIFTHARGHTSEA
jgi:hypothetical protein